MPSRLRGIRLMNRGTGGIRLRPAFNKRLVWLVATAWLGASEGIAHTYGRIAEITMLEEPWIDDIPTCFLLLIFVPLIVKRGFYTFFFLILDESNFYLKNILFLLVIIQLLLMSSKRFYKFIIKIIAVY